MTSDHVIQIFKSTFTFNPSLDLPGISFILGAIVVNIMSLVGSSPPPFIAWILYILAIVYFVVKIIGAILDNLIKKKKLDG